MSLKHLGKQSVVLPSAPSVTAATSVVGSKEGQGPLRRHFDRISDDSLFGTKSWEAAESAMLRESCRLACDKAGIEPDALGYILAGDLLNQCVGTSYALRGCSAPVLGLYSACASFGEALGLAAMLIDGGFCDSAMAAASSHFCSAERQFRMPLPYGSQRPPTAQWTVTGAGAAILRAGGNGPHITHVTSGHIYDAGIADMANMGAAMAPAAYSTLTAHFEDTGRSPEDYDAIVTGDLGVTGSELLRELFRRDGVELGTRYMDCGRLIYAIDAQDAHAGGSGCGCSASVFCGHLLDGLREGLWRRLLFAPTGALMSPTVSQQGETIPAICHAVALDMEVGSWD